MANPDPSSAFQEAIPGQANKKKKRSWWWYAGSALVTLVSLAVLGRLIFTNLDALAQIRSSVRVWPLVLTFPLFFVTEFISSVAWGIIMNDITRPLPSSIHRVIFFVTHAARRIPGTIWHVVGRVAWYERLGISKSISAFANVLETVLIILSGIVVSLALFPFITAIENGQILLILVGAVLSIVLIRPETIRFVMNKLGQQPYSQALTYKRILAWLALYPILWIFGGLILYLTITGLTPVPPTLIPVSIAAWSIAGVTGMLLVLLPSGFGLTEAALSLLLAPHISPGVAVSAALLMRILLTAYEFFFAGLFYLLRKKFTVDAGHTPKQAH